jgi:hypothetical protein
VRAIIVIKPLPAKDEEASRGYAVPSFDIGGLPSTTLAATREIYLQRMLLGLHHMH